MAESKSATGHFESTAYAEKSVKPYAKHQRLRGDLSNHPPPLESDAAAPAGTGNGGYSSDDAASGYHITVSRQSLSLSDLDHLPMWVAWREISAEDGRARKVPYSPHTGQKATGKHSTWGGTRKAAQRLARGLLNGTGKGGVGIVLGPIPGRPDVFLGGLDGDRCFDRRTGEIADWARPVFGRFDTYTEESPSGEGQKAFFLYTAEDRLRLLKALKTADGEQRLGRPFKPKAEQVGGHRPGFEFYAGDRFFTETTKRMPGSSDELRIVPVETLLWFLEKEGPDYVRRANGDADSHSASHVLDESRSGRAYRLALEVHRNGESEDSFREQLAGDGELAAWAADERQARRAWERAGEKVDREREALIAKFDVLPPLLIEDRKNRSPLRLHRIGDLDAMPDAIDFVEGVLYDGQLSEIFGAPSAGKTFFVLDIGLHVATGRKWHGKDVERGGLLFIALEGVQGIKRRIKAWCKWHKIDDPASLPVAVIDGSLNLRTGTDSRKWIIDQTTQLQTEWKIPVRLIVIDTLNRAMAGGNESASEDMGALISGADQIRRATKSHVMLIHHPGKDESKGSRGHSSLLGAVDTEISITSERDSRVALITKQKEGKDGARFAFELENVTLDYRDRRGNPVTSAVALPVTVAAFDDLDGAPETSRAAFSILRNIFKRDRCFGDFVAGLPLEIWRSKLKEADWPSADATPDAIKSAFKRAKEKLVEKGRIRIDGEIVRIIAHGNQLVSRCHPVSRHHDT